MDNRPVGIFDSGLGGLTALSVFRRLMPRESIIYFADTGRVPYGGRDCEELRRMTVQDLELLESMGVKAIITACGTVSSTAPDILSAFRLPVTGVIAPAVIEVERVCSREPVAIIATRAAVRARGYEKELKAADPDREILAVPCPEFVPLIEAGHTGKDDPLLREAVERTLAPVKASGVSALILGCTHYGIIADAIREYLGDKVRLISAAGCAAAYMADYLRQNEMTGEGASVRFFTSGDETEFRTKASALLGFEAEDVTQLPTMEVL